MSSTASGIVLLMRYRPFCELKISFVLMIALIYRQITREFLCWTYTLVGDLMVINFPSVHVLCTNLLILYPFPIHGHLFMQKNSLDHGIFEL